MNPEFLTLDDVLDIHAQQIERFGGLNGLRDQDLLESALAQPAMMFSEQYLHPDLLTMAGAYLYHIVCNHPFMDGNKRTGLLSALVFLDINGITVDYGSDKLYALTMRLAEGRLSKEETIRQLQEIV